MTTHESRLADARLHTLLTGERTGWRFIIPTEQDEMDVYVIGEFDPIIGDKRGLVPDYHTWAGAGLVIDRMRELGWRLYSMEELVNGRKRAVFVLKAGVPWWDEYEAYADTFPAAVAASAEAALNAGRGDTCAGN
jgi:hypothetical protein